MKKKDYLQIPVRHIDITSFDATPIIEAMKGMSFTARDLATAAGIYDRMVAEPRRCFLGKTGGIASPLHR